MRAKIAGTQEQIKELIEKMGDKFEVTNVSPFYREKGRGTRSREGFVHADIQLKDEYLPEPLKRILDSYK